MNIKSVTFDCPVLFKGRVNSIEEIHAPELNNYINSVIYNEARSHLLVVNFNNAQYVIDFIKNYYTAKKNNLSKCLLQISNILHATVSIIQVTLNNDSSYSFKTIQLVEYSPTSNSITDEILYKFPKLYFFTKSLHVIEYDNNYTVPKYIDNNTNYIYLVVLPFKDKQYVIAHYTKREKADLFINKFQLEGAFIVDINVHLSNK